MNSMQMSKGRKDQVQHQSTEAALAPSEICKKRGRLTTRCLLYYSIAAVECVWIRCVLFDTDMNVCWCRSNAIDVIRYSLADCSSIDMEFVQLKGQYETLRQVLPGDYVTPLSC